MPIQWRYSDGGDGQPGATQTVEATGPEIAVTGIEPDREIQIDTAGNGFTGDFLTRRTKPADTDPAKVPTIKTAYGNRPLPIPFRQYRDGQDELLAPNTHPMVGMFTHVAVKDGRFNDPTVWSTGTVPGAGSVWSTDRFYIRYTHESDDIMAAGLVPLAGRLVHMSDGDTRMRIGYLMTMGIHSINDQEWSATLGKPKHEIVFHPVGDAPGASAKLGAMFMGPTRHVGAVATEQLRLKPESGQAIASVLPGATSIALTGLADAVAAGTIRVGAVMVISATEYIERATSDPEYTGPTSYYTSSLEAVQRNLNKYQFSQSEERTITSLAGDVAYFDEPLEYQHTGQQRTLKDGQVITLNPTVAFPCRSVRFRTASAQQDGGIDPNADLTVLQKRAHIMYHRCPDVYVQDVEGMNMGRTMQDPSLYVPGLPYTVEMAGGAVTVGPILTAQGGTPLSDEPAYQNNVIGRYCFHFHFCGGPFAPAPLVVCRRVSAWAPKWAPPCPGWGIVQHGSNMAIERCVGINVRGAAIVSELGNERGHWAWNVAMDCRGVGEGNAWGDRHERYANHNGSSGVAFENQSRAILLHNNVASGCHYAYLWHAQKDKRPTRGLRDTDMRLMPTLYKGEIVPLSMAREDEVIHQTDAQIPPFMNNEAWACRFGMAVIHRGGDSRKHSPEPMLIENLHGVNVPHFIHLPQYTNAYYFKDCSSSISPDHQPGSIWAEIGNVAWDFNYFNCYIDGYEYEFYDQGIGLNYNGFIVDVTSDNTLNTSNIVYRPVSGSHASRDVMGPWVEDPSNPGNWRIRILESIDSSTLPTPYPLAPYGAHLPEGSPVVPVGGQPYFVPDAGNNLTLKAGDGRNKGSFAGIIRDCAGDRRLGDWQSSESFPNNLFVRGPLNLAKTQPEQLVERWGCWNDAGTWRCRTWFLYADRLTHVPLAFHADWTLTGFGADFLAAHEIAGPPPAPSFPFELERTRQTPRPLAPIVEPVAMLSRTRLEVVEGQPLAHRLRPNRVSYKAEIVGGANAADFELASMGQVLRFVGNSTRTVGTYNVTVRISDVWGNSVDADHEVIAVPSARVSADITDSFNRADEDLDANPAYVLKGAQPGSFRIVSNRLSAIAATNDALVDMGSLGTSEQLVWCSFNNWNDSLVAFRVIDENNWLGFHRYDGGSSFRFRMRLNGVTSTLVEFANINADQVAVRVEGRKMVVARNIGTIYEPVVLYPKNLHLCRLLTQDTMSEAGAILLPENAPMGTNVGLITSTRAAAPWIDNFHAEALP
mgnify:CR=1 FL=1